MWSSYSNVHVSSHPIAQAKISRLRAKSTGTREIRELTDSVTTILAVEALSSQTFATVPEGSRVTPLNEQFGSIAVMPNKIVLVPVLRSGLPMIDALLNLLPFETVPIHYLGLFRDKQNLSPVEYYNKLPVREENQELTDIAIVLDPVIATGGTMSAVIQSLREWGVRKIIVISLVASEEGLQKLASEWFDIVTIYCAAVDKSLSSSGYVLPGIGDIGNRLNATFQTN
ncbi:uracil phosphoribosyltransferase-domain-containing protein [Dipodascopsis uninucleata]